MDFSGRSAASFLALRFGGVGRIPTGLFRRRLVHPRRSHRRDFLPARVSRRTDHAALAPRLSRRPSSAEPPYSIAMVDIDHFKRCNDTYGHDTGDQVLRLVASRLARVTGGGQAYRCGGEEFAILFPGKTTIDVLEHLEKLRADIEASTLPLAWRRPPARGARPRPPQPARSRPRPNRTRDPRNSRASSAVDRTLGHREHWSCHFKAGKSVCGRSHSGRRQSALPRESRRTQPDRNCFRLAPPRSQQNRRHRLNGLQSPWIVGDRDCGDCSELRAD